MEQRSMQGVLLTVHLLQAEEYSYSTPIPLYICLSCFSGVHLTLHLFCRCTTEIVLLQQGVLLGSLWECNHLFNSVNFDSENSSIVGGGAVRFCLCCNTTHPARVWYNTNNGYSSGKWPWLNIDLLPCPPPPLMKEIHNGKGPLLTLMEDIMVGACCSYLLLSLI